MVVIGLTGGIGAGKSTVARLLEELGASVIDADAVARAVVEPGRPAWRELVAAFGAGILAADGRIDRRELARRAFADPDARARLNRATHPHILREIRRRLQALAARSCPVAVLDAPLLLETGLDAAADEVWVVVADPEQEAARAAARSGWTAEEVQARARGQMGREERLRRAHVVIDNRGSLEETRRQVRAAWKRLMSRASGGATS